jgi:putative peptidoglycan lipid II flippase
MYAAVAGFAMALIGSILLMPGMGHLGVALATGLSGWVSAGVLAGLIARRFGFSLDANARYRLPRILAAALVMGAALAALQMALAPWLGGEVSQLRRLAGLAMLLAAGTAVYGALLHFSGATPLRQLVTAWRRGA